MRDDEPWTRWRELPWSINRLEMVIQMGILPFDWILRKKGADMIVEKISDG